MDFWENFTKTISQATDHTVKSTEKLATVAKLKYRISTFKSKLDDYFRTLGEMKYSEMSGDEVGEEEYGMIFDEIVLLEKKISVLEKRVASLNDYVECPQCGYKVRRGVSVCPYCEFVIDEEAFEAEKKAAEEAAKKAAEEAAEAAAAAVEDVTDEIAGAVEDLSEKAEEE